MQVICRKPRQEPEVKDIEGSLEELQELIGGGFIEIVNILPGIVVVCDDMAKLKSADPNIIYGNPEVGYDYIAGDIVVASRRGPDLVGLDTLQVGLVLGYIKAMDGKILMQPVEKPKC